MKKIKHIVSVLLVLAFFNTNLQAQVCPSPTATRTVAMTSTGTGGIGSGIQDGPNDVVYYTGTGNYLALSAANPTGTVVLAAGAHVTVQYLSVDAGSRLILQTGATISVTGTPRATINPNVHDFSVSGGGSIQMCQNSAIEACGNTQFFTPNSLLYVGVADGKAVFKGQRNITGALRFSSQGCCTTNSPNLFIVYENNPNYLVQNTGSTGYATLCTIGGPCAPLPYILTTNCGDLINQNPCNAGTAAPVLSATSISNVCPAATINLTTITASNQPTNTTLTWHTGTPATTANKITGTAVAAGTYYAAFFDAANNCYSPTRAVTAISNGCASGTIDCSKTQFFSAPVAGQPGQKTLVVTINVTTAGCFSPVTISGSGITLANNAQQVCTTTTGVQTFSIPVNYNGAALGTVTFTVGSAGSCTADLTVPPKPTDCNIWTLECVPTKAPALK